MNPNVWKANRTLLLLLLLLEEEEEEHCVAPNFSYALNFIFHNGELEEVD